MLRSWSALTLKLGEARQFYSQTAMNVNKLTRSTEFFAENCMLDFLNVRRKSTRKQANPTQELKHTYREGGGEI